MKAILMEIGRNKVSREVECATAKDVLSEVRKHLMSSDVWITFDEDSIGTVFAGMRSVGKVAIEGGFNPNEFDQLETD